jgi:serine/threonine protein kinase
MGEVFVARTPWPDNPLAAVKRLRPDVARVPTFAERFAHEAELAVRLSHPNVVGTLDIGSVEGQLYVASELVYGKDTGLIADRLRERGQGGPAAVAIRLLLDTLGGLAYVHGVREPDGKPLRLVHRDVTPGNVLVGYDGQARLADFGLAKSLLTEKSHLTNHGEILGTPHYLAPEVIRGDQASPVSDLYGVGAVMYRFLTGIAPHQGTTAEVLLKVLSEEPRSLSDLRPDLAPWLVSFVHRLLEKDPSRRPYDASVLIQQLSHDAKNSGLLVNKAAVARWIANLFDVEKAEEMEERDRIVEIDLEQLGGKQEGTVVLARPGASSSLEAPLQLINGYEDDRDTSGTELDLSEAQVRAVVGQLDPRFASTGPPVPAPSLLASGTKEMDSVDGMPTRAVQIWPRDQQPTTDAGPAPRGPSGNFENSSPDGPADEATRLGEIVQGSGPTRLPGFVEVANRDPASITFDPEPGPRQRPRNKDSVVVGPAAVSARPPPERRPEPTVIPATPGPVPVHRGPRSGGPVASPKGGIATSAPVATAKPIATQSPVQVVAKPSEQPRPAPPAQRRAPPQRSANTWVFLAVLLVVAVILGVGIGSYIAQLRGDRPATAEVRGLQRDRFLALQRDLNERQQKGETLPAGAWEAYGAAAAAMVEGNEGKMKKALDQVEVLLKK